MAKILNFPSYASISVRSSGDHRIRVKIVDAKRVEEARWSLQFAVQRAASFNAIDGLTEAAAHAGRWHSFTIGKRQLLRRFVDDVQPLVVLGRVIVEVDGKRMRPLGLKVA